MLRMLKKNTVGILICGLSLVLIAFSPTSEIVGPASVKQSYSSKLNAKLELKKPDFSNLKNWGIFNSGDSHIHVTDAWKIQKGNRNIVVAVIDTGIDPKHPLLKNNLWKSPKDPSVYGWNFVTNKPNPTDDHGHGTHVAGIIGATTDLTQGISGVIQNVSIMAVKYYSEASPGAVNLSNTIKALNYAIDNGAQIINYSGGGPEFSEDEYLAMKKAEAKGILVVAAAGNERKNSDLIENYYYPAAYGLSNIISVAAIDRDNLLLRSSNWGVKKVDVAAPGENIYSTLPDGRVGYMSGTSQATAFVSGMAALLLSQDSSLTPSKIKEIIRGSTDSIATLKGRIASGGRVNAYKSLIALTTPKSETLTAVTETASNTLIKSNSPRDIAVGSAGSSSKPTIGTQPTNPGAVL